MVWPAKTSQPCSWPPPPWHPDRLPAPLQASCPPHADQKRINEIAVRLGAATITDGDQHTVLDHAVQCPAHRPLKTSRLLLAAAHLVERHRPPLVADHVDRQPLYPSGAARHHHSPCLSVHSEHLVSRSSRLRFSRALNSAPINIARSPKLEPVSVPTKLALPAGRVASHFQNSSNINPTQNVWSRRSPIIAFRAHYAYNATGDSFFRGEFDLSWLGANRMMGYPT
jgi:hypothetical protein